MDTPLALPPLQLFLRFLSVFLLPSFSPPPLAPTSSITITQLPLDTVPQSPVIRNRFELSPCAPLLPPPALPSSLPPPPPPFISPPITVFACMTPAPHGIGDGVLRCVSLALKVFFGVRACIYTMQAYLCRLYVVFRNFKAN